MATSIATFQAILKVCATKNLKKLYADLSYFDLNRFSETVLHEIPISAVNMICNLFPNKSSDSPVQQDLRQELLDFASKWPELKKILPEHCTELDEAGDHFFDIIIDKIFTG